MSIYKKIALFLAVFAVLGGAFIINAPKVKALTVDELQAQIDTLLKQLATLQAQLAEMQGQQGEWCYDFNRNLKFGVGGEEVRALQTALQKQGFYKKDIINTFDEFTASAVVGFQEKYASEILTPWGLAHGTGYVGNTTRAKLNALYGCVLGSYSCAREVIKPGVNCGGQFYEDYCENLSNGTGYFAKRKCNATKGNSCSTLVNIEKTFCPNGCQNGACKSEQSITVISPNGGEKLEKGKTYTIRWEAPSNYLVYLGLRKFDETVISTIAGRISSEQGFYEWTIPNEISLNQYKIYANLSAVGEVSDYSDDFFSIVEKPSELTCTDSDGGKDYYVKGYTEGWTRAGAQAKTYDSCIGDGLQEWYCDGNYISETWATYQCSYGCYDGACKLGVKLSPQNPASHEVAAGASYFPIGASSEVSHKLLSFEIDNPSSHSVSINKLAVAIEGTAKSSDFGEVIWQADGKSVDSGSNSFREVGGAGYAETPDSLYYPNGTTLLTIPANSKKTIDVFAYVKSTATVGATAKFTMYANYVGAVEGFNFGGLPISGNTMTISKKSLSAEIKYQGVHNISAKAGANLSAPITIANKSSEEIKITEAVMGDPASDNNFLNHTDKNNYTIQYYDGSGTLNTAQLRDAGKNTSDGYRLFTISPGLTIPVNKEISFVVSTKLNSVISAKEFTIIFNKFSGYGATTFSPVASVGKTTGKINVSQQTSSLKDVENSLASVYNAISALIDALRQGQVEK